jgi:glycerophosphoryl diester phosphodiesterase
MLRNDITAHPPEPGVRQTLIRASGAVASRLWETVRVTLVVQGVVVLVGIPLLAWLFPVLLQLLGASSVTAIDLGELLRHPVAVSVFSVLLLGMGLLALAQVLIFLVVAGRRFRIDPASPALWIELFALTRRLVHPSTLLLIPYAALLLPFGGLALGGLFTGGVRIPFPLTSELLSTPGGTLVYLSLLLATIYVLARLILTLPLLAGGRPHVWSAMAGSWRATRGHVVRIAALVGSVILVTVVVASGIGQVGLGPTRYADGAFPEWSPLVAVLSLTLIEVALFFLAGFALAVLAQVAMWAIRPLTTHHDPPGPTVRVHGLSRRLRRAAVVIIGVVAAVSLALSNWTGLSALSDGSATMLVSHRGIVDRTVENTLAAVEAASAGDPDLVEIDVQQTADGRFVVFHDLTLSRLAGDPRRIADLTMRELRQIPIVQDGVQDRIPTLDAVLAHANRLDQPLFIELKVHGGETDDYLEQIIEALERHDALDTARVASFDRDVIERFALLEPTVPVGLVVTLALGRAPATTADFLVIGSSSYTPALRDDAWARGFELYVWTVDDMNTVRDLLRDSVDGIITNRTFAARAEKQDLIYETGVATRLEDALRRTIGW